VTTGGGGGACVTTTGGGAGVTTVVPLGADPSGAGLVIVGGSGFAVAVGGSCELLTPGGGCTAPDGFMVTYSPPRYATRSPERNTTTEPGAIVL
jgi:hypothetical protein